MNSEARQPRTDAGRKLLADPDRHGIHIGTGVLKGGPFRDAILAIEDEAWATCSLCERSALRGSPASPEAPTPASPPPLSPDERTELASLRLVRDALFESLEAEGAALAGEPPATPPEEWHKHDWDLSTPPAAPALRLAAERLVRRLDKSVAGFDDELEALREALK